MKHINLLSLACMLGFLLSFSTFAADPSTTQNEDNKDEETFIPPQLGKPNTRSSKGTRSLGIDLPSNSTEPLDTKTDLPNKTDKDQPLKEQPKTQQR